MSGGTQAVGLWAHESADDVPHGVDHGPAVEAPPLLLSTTVPDDEDDDAGLYEPRIGRDWRRIATATLCLLAAAAWLAFLGWIFTPRWTVTPPSPELIANALAVASPPLLLIGMIYMLLVRGSRTVSRRYANAAATLRQESEALEATVARLSGRIEVERQVLALSSGELSTLGDDAAQRMKGASDAMRVEIDSIARHANALKHSASAARADVAVLLADLPKAHVQTREMVSSLKAAGLAAQESATVLDAQLNTLAVRGREADQIAGGAAEKLALHLGDVERASADATTRLDAAASDMTRAIDDALSHAAEAGEVARQGLDAQGAAMLALVDQALAGLDRTGAEAGEAIGSRITAAMERVEALGALLGVQADASTQLLDRIHARLADVDGQFATLDTEGAARATRLGTAVGTLHDHARRLGEAVGAGNAQAEGLIGRSEQLMTALDAITREVDEALPAAFARLDERATASRAVVANASPEVTRIEREASAALDRLIEAEAVLAKQRSALDAYAGEATARLTEATAAATALGEAVDDADRSARQIAEGASATLVEAMVRVRETAQAAADRAREAIGSVVPQAAEHLGKASSDALAAAISDQVTDQIARVGIVANDALEAAHKASDRLMRQMLTIADTTAAVETRIAETKAEIAESDRNSFARRVALLIESLNSTAIDVTKILSNDVTDVAWAAYLRGDRGVFTRRAIRLLDAGEAREVLRHYESDPEFREQVNRYIHDFEAMLRNILATKEGTSLSVTLLSSDMGKLYVALAQAIERLRS